MLTVLFLVYLAGVADMLQTISMTALIGAAVVAAIASLPCHMEGHAKEYWEVVRKAAPWVIVAAVFAILTPSKTLLYVAAGMYAGNEVAQTEVAQKAYRVLDSKLDELLEQVPDAPNSPSNGAAAVNVRVCMHGVSASTAGPSSSTRLSGTSGRSGARGACSRSTRTGRIRG